MPHLKCNGTCLPRNVIAHLFDNVNDSDVLRFATTSRMIRSEVASTCGVGTAKVSLPVGGGMAGLWRHSTLPALAMWFRDFAKLRILSDFTLIGREQVDALQVAVGKASKWASTIGPARSTVFFGTFKFKASIVEDILQKLPAVDDDCPSSSHVVVSHGGAGVNLTLINASGASIDFGDEPGELSIKVEPVQDRISFGQIAEIFAWSTQDANVELSWAPGHEAGHSFVDEYTIEDTCEFRDALRGDLPFIFAVKWRPLRFARRRRHQA